VIVEGPRAAIAAHYAEALHAVDGDELVSVSEDFERMGDLVAALGPAVERLPLTDREREIVMLIRNGLSNRDVAQRLSLSVRTVENHIHEAMAKTGTISRDRLAGLMPGAPNAVPPS
jgi:DNA-binding CsgD family transcriptional regulator